MRHRSGPRATAKSMGWAGPLREITAQSPRGPVRMVLLEDPNGVRFELTEFV